MKKEKRDFMIKFILIFENLHKTDNSLEKRTLILAKQKKITLPVITRGQWETCVYEYAW